MLTISFFEYFLTIIITSLGTSFGSYLSNKRKAKSTHDYAYNFQCLEEGCTFAIHSSAATPMRQFIDKHLSEHKNSAVNIYIRGFDN